MPALQPDSLLAEISPDAPCGPDMSYDTGYLEVLRLAEGTPEQQIGETVKPAEEPNWREVRDKVVDLLGQTRDLRLIVLAGAATLELEGIPGLASALDLLRRTLEQYWETVHPRLDPDDDNDPLERVNIIASIAAPPETFGDTLRFRRRLREAPLCNSRQLGRYSLRDIAIANGEAPAPGGDGQTPVAMSVIDAAFEDTPVEELQAQADAAARAAEHVRNIEATLDQLIGASRAPDLEGLRRDLGEVCSCLNRYLARRGYGSVEEPAAAAPAAAGGGAVSGRGGTGEIASTQDVLLAIDRICQYYERHEPSSPVPLLLKRARRLVSKSFLDIINDLSPDALGQIKSIGGIEESAE